MRYLFALFFSIFFSSSVIADLINVAPNGSVSASSSWNGYVAENAFDGDINTVWNSGSFTPAWIEVDFGDAIEISSITALTEQQPSGNTVHDVYLDGAFSFRWNQFTANNQLLTYDFIAPVLAQNVRIFTVSSPSWIAWKDIEILSESTPVPAPSVVWLFFIGLAGMLFFKRQ